jgi:hypothetical protein
MRHSFPDAINSMIFPRSLFCRSILQFAPATTSCFRSISDTSVDAHSGSCARPFRKIAGLLADYSCLYLQHDSSRRFAGIDRQCKGEQVKAADLLTCEGYKSSTALDFLPSITLPSPSSHRQLQASRPPLALSRANTLSIPLPAAYPASWTRTSLMVLAIPASTCYPSRYRGARSTPSTT